VDAAATVGVGVAADGVGAGDAAGVGAAAGGEAAGTAIPITVQASASGSASNRPIDKPSDTPFCPEHDRQVLCGRLGAGSPDDDSLLTKFGRWLVY